jgi:hypothetical protein
MAGSIKAELVASKQLESQKVDTPDSLSVTFRGMTTVVQKREGTAIHLLIDANALHYAHD